MDTAEIWFRHRKIILIVAANVVGLAVVIVGAKLIYRATVTPEIPQPKVATEKEVVTFLASANVRRLSKTEKRQYMREVIDKVYRRPERRKRFISQLDDLRPWQLQQLKDNALDVFKEQVVEDSETYQKLSSRDRKTFIREKIAEAEELRSMLGGRDVRETSGRAAGHKADITRHKKFASVIPRDSKEAYSEFVSKTNPSDRAKLETYLNEYQAEHKRWRAEQKELKKLNKAK